jgi:hypothetical protein
MTCTPRYRWLWQKSLNPTAPLFYPMLLFNQVVSISERGKSLARANFTPHNYAFGDTPKKRARLPFGERAPILGFGNVTTAVV